MAVIWNNVIGWWALVVIGQRISKKLMVRGDAINKNYEPQGVIQGRIGRIAVVMTGAMRHWWLTGPEGGYVIEDL
ncbi:hypothetical protein J6590_009713 [Homalodisca vitripennis]|nr:hypothetical protein J6590_009713 [Homalodisca vitripennis]